MAKLIYSMLVSLDGYTEDARGKFGWSVSEDAEVHAYITELTSSVGTYLYGRRMYDTMVFWETAHEDPDAPAFVKDFAKHWQATEKVVYSRTLTETRSARTRIEPELRPDDIRALKAASKKDLTIDGPTLAAQAITASLVDEIYPIICPVIVGGGKRFLPEGVQLDLRLLGERHFDSGVIVPRYAVR